MDVLSPDIGFDVAVTRVLHTIESVCESLEDVTVANSRRRGICMFYYDPTARNRPTDARTYAFAQRIVNAVAERCGVGVRIGIGRPRTEIHHLQESYEEARAALADSDAIIVAYKRPSVLSGELSAQVDLVRHAVLERRLGEARTTLIALPMLVGRAVGDGPDSLATQRQFLLSTLEGILFSAQQIGYAAAAAAIFRSETLERLGMAREPFQLHESWIACVDRFMAEVSLLYAGKYDKLVERAKNYVDRQVEMENGGPGVSLLDTAQFVGVSSGHLSRIFRRVSGITFERYLMTKRVERAQRLLLDPTSRVSDVAEKCEFCNPAYFARVFRKIAGCSPTEYSKNPLLHSAAITNEPVRAVGRR